MFSMSEKEQIIWCMWMYAGDFLQAWGELVIVFYFES